MALPKNKRKIIVDNQIYHWIAKGNVELINLTIEDSNSNKIFAQFNYDTLHKKSNYYDFPFIVTPYIVRETILSANKNYPPKNKAIDLGNLSKEIRLFSLAERKMKKILKSIESRIAKADTNSKVEGVEFVLKETRHFIKYGELLIGLENMIDNLAEIAFRFNEEELILLKDISEMSRLSWDAIRSRLIASIKNKNEG